MSLQFVYSFNEWMFRYHLNYLHILDTDALSEVELTQILSRRLPLHSGIPFAAQETFSVTWSHLLFVALISCVVGVTFRKSLPFPRTSSISLKFSSRNFKISSLYI